MESTRQALARANLGGSSFAQDILGEQGMRVNDQIADIGPDVASKFIAGAPGIVQLGEGGFGPAQSAAGLDIRNHATSTPSEWSTFMGGLMGGMSGGSSLSGLSGLGGGGGGVAAGAPISMQDMFTAGDTTGMGAGAFAGATEAGGGAAAGGSSLASLLALL